MPSPGQKVESAVLIALCIVLPLYEAPKNLAWLVYILIWFANRARTRDFGGAWDLWDTLIAAWIASTFVVAAFAGLHGSEWRGALDSVRYGMVLWLLRRSRFTERQLRLLLGALVFSAVLGVGIAAWRVWAGTHERIELNSVGHVNHTAIYLAIVLGLCVSWLFAGPLRFVAGVAAAVLLLALFATASRGALAAGVLASGVIAAAWWRRSRWPALGMAIVLAATALVAVFGSATVFEKQKAQFAQGDILNLRGRAWDIAVGAWERHPWFGVGIDNFSLLTRAEEEPYRTLFTHAHSLYLNTLAERGVVGASLVLVLLFAALVALVRARPRPPDSAQAWLLWGAALAAWIVTAVAGIVNTTLHHEHALLVALLLGLWLGSRQRA